MREIERTSRFKRDYRRERSGHLGKKLDVLLLEVLDLLVTDAVLPRRYFDHPLSGDWSGFRDCHGDGAQCDRPHKRRRHDGGLI
jgi:mRNA interferase YafQ